ncbi:hypothetical protein D3C71_1489980 [compost metagenome]
MLKLVHERAHACCIARLASLNRVRERLLSSLLFLRPIRQELPNLPTGFRRNLKPRLDLLLVKDRLQRVQRIRRIPIQRRDRLRGRLAGQRQLSRFVTNDDRAAADAALRGGTAIAACRHRHRRAHAKAATARGDRRAMLLACAAGHLAVLGGTQA